MEVSQKIIDYAIWYYLRYYPSTKKLIQKLNEKFGVASENGKKYGGIGDEEIDFIIKEKLRNVIQEREVCRSKINNYVNKNKNLNYIKNKMREKLFEKDLFEEILASEFLEEGESILDKDYLERQIINLKNKGKSRNYIRNKFIERKEDKDLVENILNEIFLNGELENLKREYNKIEGRFEERKIIEKLIRKGFSYNDIKSILTEE